MSGYDYSIHYFFRVGHRLYCQQGVPDARVADPAEACAEKKGKEIDGRAYAERLVRALID